jgi:hypothetical protein
MGSLTSRGKVRGADDGTDDGADDGTAARDSSAVPCFGGKSPRVKLFATDQDRSRRV